MNSTLSGIVAFLHMFFAKSPAVDDVLTVVGQVGPAILAAKSGNAFSVSFPESIGGKAGTSTFAWTPNTQ